MKKLALIAATAGSLATCAVAAPAEARGGFGPGLAGGLIAGAVIGGIASNGPGYCCSVMLHFGCGPNFRAKCKRGCSRRQCLWTLPSETAWRYFYMTVIQRQRIRQSPQLWRRPTQSVAKTIVNTTWICRAML